MKRTVENTTPAKFSELPKSYAALCAILMPRTIHDEIELGNVTAIIDLILAADFEHQNVPALPKLAPHKLLAAHLENIGMSASRWGELIGIDRSTTSRLLRGERSLNTTHIRNTATALAIAPELLI